MRERERPFAKERVVPAPSPSVRLGGQEVEELASDGPVDAVPEGVQRGVLRGGVSGWLEPR